MKLNKCKCDISLCTRLLKTVIIYGNGSKVPGYPVDGMCPVERNLTVGDNVVYCYKREEGVE